MRSGSRDVLCDQVPPRKGVELNAKLIICAVTGHHWSPATDIHDTFPVLRCRRCRSEQGRSAETRGPEGWGERAGRAARVDHLMDGKIQRRP